MGCLPRSVTIILFICVSDADVDADRGRNDASVNETMPVPAPIHIFKRFELHTRLGLTNLVQLYAVVSKKTACPITF